MGEIAGLNFILSKIAKTIEKEVKRFTVFGEFYC